jgi:hypothetical protein
MSRPPLRAGPAPFQRFGRDYPVKSDGSYVDERLLPTLTICRAVPGGVLRRLPVRRGWNAAKKPCLAY